MLYKDTMHTHTTTRIALITALFGLMAAPVGCTTSGGKLESSADSIMNAKEKRDREEAAEERAAKQEAERKEAEPFQTAVAAKDFDVLYTACYKRTFEDNRVSSERQQTACDTLGTITMETIAAGDQAAVEGICFNNTVRGQRVVDDEQRKAGCDKLVEIYATKAKGLTCENTEAMWEEMKEFAQPSFLPTYFAIGDKAAECGQWDFIFASLVANQYNGQDGLAMLQRLDKNGVDVDKRYATHIKKHGAPDSYNTASNYADFIKKDSKELSSCSAHASAASSWTGLDARHMLETLFYADNCVSSARSYAVDMLAHDASRNRSQACAVLGKIGTKREMKKVNIVANYDRDDTVRRECTDAIGQIKLRN